MLFNIGFSEFIVISLIAVLILGPEKLPSFAISFAKSISEFKKILNKIFIDLNVNNKILNSLIKIEPNLLDNSKYIKKKTNLN